MISFDVSARDADLITRIVKRADAAYQLAGGSKIDRRDVAMSLTACHANGCPLDLEKLLAADDFNLLHDVSGIHRHISTEDAQLGGCFLPRVAPEAGRPRGERGGWTMTPLHSIKTSKFPLNWKRYNKLYDEIDAAAKGVADIGHHDLATAMEKVRAELWNAWNLIQSKEQAEAAKKDH